MTLRQPARRSYTVVDVIVYLIGVVGLSFAITAVSLGMRSVMDIGGSCGAPAGPTSRSGMPFKASM